MKKLATVLITLLIAVSACACSSTVSVYYQSVGNANYYSFSIQISTEDMEQLNTSATTMPNGEQKYSVATYFKGFCQQFPSSLTYVQTLTPQQTGEDYYLTSISLISAKSDGENDEQESESLYKAEVERGFWLNKVSVTQENPLATYLNSYDNPKQGTLFDYLKNGVMGEQGEVIYPAITDAFPVLKDAVRDGMKLEFYMQSPKWYVSSDGEAINYQGVDFVKWQCVLGEQISPTVTYEYRTPNSLGWSVTLAVLSLIVVAISWLILRKNNEQPKLICRKSSEPVIKRKLSIAEAEQLSKKMEEMNEQFRQSIDPFDDSPAPTNPISREENQNSEQNEDVNPFE